MESVKINKMNIGGFELSNSKNSKNNDQYDNFGVRVFRIHFLQKMLMIVKPLGSIVLNLKAP